MSLLKFLISYNAKLTYLINVSPFGPNNQLRGFRDTIILAIYLNRTIVMPPFFKHRSDPSQSRLNYIYQDGSQKVDPLKLAELLPVISLQTFSKVCKKGLDVMFLAREKPGHNLGCSVTPLWITEQTPLIYWTVKNGVFKYCTESNRYSAIFWRIELICYSNVFVRWYFNHRKSDLRGINGKRVFRF